MLKLPEVTLIALTNRDWEGHKKAIDKSCEGIEFGGVKLIWDETIKDINDWNKKIIYDLPKYIDTDFALLIHADGYVKNPNIWSQKYEGKVKGTWEDWIYEGELGKLNKEITFGRLWEKYDYVGAPWPLPTDDYSYLDDGGELVRVGNSVSLRSKKLMNLVATREWKSYHGNTNEDGFICCHNRSFLKSQGCKFAPLEVAIHFSKEHEIPENVGLETFAFHSL